MKRFIPIILAAFVLLFSGCDKTEYYATFEEASKSLETIPAEYVTMTSTMLKVIPIEEKFVVLYCDAYEESDGTIVNAFRLATISKNDKDMYFVEKQSVKSGTAGGVLSVIFTDTEYLAPDNKWNIHFTISEKDGRAVKSLSDINFSYEIEYNDLPAS